MIILQTNSKKIKKYFLLIVLNFLFLLSKPLHAQQGRSFDNDSKPLWELGMGLIGLNMPDYPGSGHNRTRFIPFPAYFYRGEVLRADEDGGVRSRFINTENIELHLSVGGSLPANSKDNPTRLGMPDLDWLFELGPGIIFHLIKPSKKNKMKLKLVIPIRSVFSTDFRDDISHQGYIFNPLLFTFLNKFPFEKTRLLVSLGILVGDRKLNELFYSVEPQYANKTRPEYQAKAGYMGINTGIGMSYIFNQRLLGFIGARYSNYQNAKNTPSPLLEEKHTFSLATGLVWWFYESKQKGSR